MLAILLFIFSVATSYKDLNFFNRYVVPVVASLGALYLVYGAYTSDTLMFAYFTLIVAVLGVAGAVLYSSKKTKKAIE
jgi:hypothetical protein